MRRYTVVYRVVVNDQTDDPLEATDTLSLPAVGTYYQTSATSDIGATLRNKSAEQDADNPKVWEVVCEYSSEREGAVNGYSGPESRVPDAAAFPQGDRPGQAGGSGGSTARGSETERDPTQRVPDIQWGIRTNREPFEVDARGAPVMNVNGERFAPVPEREATSLTLTISRNELIWDPLIPLKYAQTTNSDEVTLGIYKFAPGTVKCESIKADAQYENGVFYYRTTFQLEIRPLKNGYDASVVQVYEVSPDRSLIQVPASEPFSSYAIDVLNVGTRAFSVERGGWYQIADSSATPMGQSLLDENGAEIPVGSNGRPSKLVYLRYYPHESRNFDLLHLNG